MQSVEPASWDVMILNFDGHTPLPVTSFRPGQGPRPMGPPTSVRADIDMAIADVDWTNPRHGVLSAEALCLSFDLGDREGALDGFLVHLSNREGAALVAHMCLVNGWAALDVTRGIYLDLEDPDRWESGRKVGAA